MTGIDICIEEHEQGHIDAGDCMMDASCETQVNTRVTQLEGLGSCVDHCTGP